MLKPIFALVDGNSFYASCQIAFEPYLESRPVVVLSNNDGCIVAANKIAKDLNKELIDQVGSLGAGGYKAATLQSMMFQPYFKVRWLLDKYRAVVFSSNYELYGDMSNRMHSIAGSFAVRQEIYSIDESFLDLTGLDKLYDLTAYAQEIRSKLKKDIGIPVAVGIAHSKTLAKLANHLAKKAPHLNDVLDLSALSNAALDDLFEQVEVGKVWGVGRQLSARLNADNILSVKDFKYANIQTIRQKYGVVGERIVRELNGESCLSLDEVYPNKKQIISSRSFGVVVTDYQEMEQALVAYTLRAAEKLRRQNSVCNYLTISIRTNPFKQNETRYSNSHTLGLIYPSDNSILLAKLAKRALKKIWIPGLAYQKAGVALSEITLKTPLQTDLFAPNPQYSGNDKQAKLMAIMDEINQKNGRGTLFLGAQGTQAKPSWQMNRKLMSPRYTSRWDELLCVR